MRRYVGPWIVLGCAAALSIPVPTASAGGTVAVQLPPLVSATVGETVQLRVEAYSPDGGPLLYEWDLDGDDILETRSQDAVVVTQTYRTPGIYDVKLRVTDHLGAAGAARTRVVVGRVGEAVEGPEPGSRRPPRTPAAARSGDGVQTIYALIETGSASVHWNVSRKFYNLLTGPFGADPGNLYVLLADSGTPSSSPEIVYGRAARDTIENLIADIASTIDEDDLFVFHIEWHGTGYLGYVPDDLRNVALHGFFHNPPYIAGPGDEHDYLESDLEMSLLCASGGYDGRDFHYGIGEWGVSYYPYSRLKRHLALSHFDSLYVESHGYVSDSDVWIEQFTDYTLGDFDKDGYIETDEGETWDWDGDGHDAWERDTGLFDEDDWGELDSFEDDSPYYGFHSQLGGIPFEVYDAGLDGLLDIDIYPDSAPGIDGTDVDNDGCIDGLDVNCDGDMDDWVGIDEKMSIYYEMLLDDEVRDLLDWIPCGTKLFITNTCYGGGFVDDLSDTGTIVISGSREVCGASAAFMPGLFNQALGTYRDEADVDGDGAVSIAEAFNHASVHPHMGCRVGMDRFQYDDNGDQVSHEDPLPNGGDGAFGSLVCFEDTWADVAGDQPGGDPVLTVGPSPFGAETTISYSLAAKGPVRLAVYDVSGRLVRCLADDVKGAGPHTASWYGRDALGRGVASGVYFVRLDAPGTTLSRKLVHLE